MLELPSVIIKEDGQTDGCTPHIYVLCIAEFSVNSAYLAVTKNQFPEAIYNSFYTSITISSNMLCLSIPLLGS